MPNPCAIGLLACRSPIATDPIVGQVGTLWVRPIGNHASPVGQPIVAAAAFQAASSPLANRSHPHPESKPHDS
jgi:hypothetical protein